MLPPIVFWIQIIFPLVIAFFLLRVMVGEQLLFPLGTELLLIPCHIRMETVNNELDLATLTPNLGITDKLHHAVMQKWLFHLLRKSLVNIL